MKRNSSGEASPLSRDEYWQSRSDKRPCSGTSSEYRSTYNHALQDLVNHIGSMLGFDVVFGCYQGVSGEMGFNGHWKSSSGLYVVVEVKTSERYSVKTATLIEYVNSLISEKAIPDPSSALGLYVIGRPEPEIHQLENAIVAVKRINPLRVVSVESLLSLAELMNELMNEETRLYCSHPEAMPNPQTKRQPRTQTEKTLDGDLEDKEPRSGKLKPP